VTEEGRTSILRPPQSTTSNAQLDRLFPLGSLPASFTGDKPAALFCFILVQAPLFKLALQGAQRRTVIPVHSGDFFIYFSSRLG